MSSDRRELAAETQAPKAIALIGSGPTTREIKRILSLNSRKHIVSIGVEPQPDPVTACALAAEILECDSLVFAPNFDNLAAALEEGSQRRPLLLQLARSVLDAARKAQIRQVVLITTAMVYGAEAGREPALDSAPL